MFFPFLALLFTVCLHLVRANDPNIGFAASINTTGIIVYPADDVAYLVGPSTIEYTFIVPVTITRRASSADVLSLALFSAPYDYDEDDPPEEVQVFQQTVYLDRVGSYDVTATFNLTTPSTASVVYSLRAQVDILDNARGNSSGYRDTISGAAVLAYTASSGTWTTLQPSTYAHTENVVIHAEYDTELAAVAEPVIDTTEETVIRDQEPDLPEEEESRTPPGEDGKTTVPCTCMKPKKPCGKDKDEPTAHCRDFKSWKRKNDGTWKEPADDASCPPVPECPPPPCATDKHEAHPIYARQSTSTERGTLRLTLTYGPASAASPIRQLSVTAFGVVNERLLAARGKTDNNGFVTLRFPLRPHEVLQVYKVSVSLDAEKFRVSTSEDEGRSFLFWRLNSVPLAWEVAAGGESTLTYRFMNKATNDILNVQDRMLTYWVFAKTRIFNFRAKLPHIWFPGQVGSNYFADPSGSGAALETAFINIHPEKAKFTSAQAHEYGHWFHYLVRRLQKVEYDLVGESHNFCQQGTANSAVVSLTEGYATAFALSALWRSKYQEATGTGYCWFPFDPTAPDCLEIEQYDCEAPAPSARDLSTDEGRVAAVMRDLIDTRVDGNDGDEGRGANGFSDAVNLPYVRVLFDPMRENPTSMEDYWNNFKAIPSLSQAQIDAAWNAFEFQYAQFDK